MHFPESKLLYSYSNSKFAAEVPVDESALVLVMVWCQTGDKPLTHLPLVSHICVCQLGQHWFRKWLVAYLAPNHYLNQCWLIVNWTPRNKLQWNFDQNTKFFIHESAFENLICEMATMLSRGSWVNWTKDGTVHWHIYRSPNLNELMT